MVIEAVRVPKNPRHERRSHPVTVRRIDPAVIREALILAGGDHSRLRIEADGSVTVANTKR